MGEETLSTQRDQIITTLGVQMDWQIFYIIGGAVVVLILVIAGAAWLLHAFEKNFEFMERLNRGDPPPGSYPGQQRHFPPE